MRLLLVLAVSGLAACVTPSIPIPPPDPADVTVMFNATSGKFSMTYPPEHAYIGGVAYVYDRTSGIGIIENVNADGSVGPTPEMSAQLGDNIVFSIENEHETVSTCFVLRDGAQDPNVYCQ
jgi:hypothetical protein